MNPQANPVSREQMARYIMAEPEHYMICQGCGSILNRAITAVCPQCHAYTFTYDLQTIVNQAAELGNRLSESWLE